MKGYLPSLTIRRKWANKMMNISKGNLVLVVADNTQQALLALIEKWKKNLDDNGYGGAVLVDLFKAFSTLKDDLLIAKLSVCGFKHDALKHIYSYLTNRWYRM